MIALLWAFASRLSSEMYKTSVVVYLASEEEPAGAVRTLKNTSEAVNIYCSESINLKNLVINKPIYNYGKTL